MIGGFGNHEEVLFSETGIEVLLSFISGVHGDNTVITMGKPFIIAPGDEEEKPFPSQYSHIKRVELEESMNRIKNFAMGSIGTGANIWKGEKYHIQLIELGDDKEYAKHIAALD